MGNGNDTDGSGDEGNKTPKEEKVDNEDPSSGGGRTTRGRFNNRHDSVKYR
jgi:hypothetical protein